MAAEEKLLLGDSSDETSHKLTEVEEKLDANDEVLSGSLRAPDEAVPEIINGLREVGLAETGTTEELEAPTRAVDRNSGRKSTIATDQTQSGSYPTRESGHMDKDAPFSSQVLSMAKPAETLTAELDGDTRDKASQSMPASLNEESRDAQLRQEMLEYSMNEVGAVVAEMNLEEGDEDDMSDSDDLSGLEEEEGEEEDDEDEEDEDEDEFGRATGRLLDDGYRARMLALERKLNAKALINVGREQAEQEPHNSSRQESTQRASLGAKKPAKGVRFADALDIQEPSFSSTYHSVEHSERPISDFVVEKPQNKAALPARASNEANNDREAFQLPIRGTREFNQSSVSQLTGATQATSNLQPIAVSEQFQGKPIVASLLSKVAGPPRKRQRFEGTHGDIFEQPLEKFNQEVTEPDELYPHVLQQEVATELQRQKNRSIQQQGGFTEYFNEEELPVDEKGRKMSRFKAARLSKTG